MVKKIKKYLKFVVCCALIMSLVAPSYAALSASDGSAFVTKAEFDSALADFNARLTTFEAGINSKIDSQVSSYLDRNGIWNGKVQEIADDYKKGYLVTTDEMTGNPWTKELTSSTTTWYYKIVGNRSADGYSSQTGGDFRKNLVPARSQGKIHCLIPSINKTGLLMGRYAFRFDSQLQNVPICPSLGSSAQPTSESSTHRLSGSTWGYTETDPDNETKESWLYKFIRSKTKTTDMLSNFSYGYHNGTNWEINDAWRGLMLMCNTYQGAGTLYSQTIVISLYTGVYHTTTGVFDKGSTFTFFTFTDPYPITNDNKKPERLDGWGYSTPGLHDNTFIGNAMQFVSKNDVFAFQVSAVAVGRSAPTHCYFANLAYDQSIYCAAVWDECKVF